jgi:hypothetical protein
MSFGYHSKFESRASYGGGLFSSADGFMSKTQQPLLPYQREYKTNGTGRDTYIAFNNGGFNQVQLHTKEDTGTFGGGKGSSKFFHRTSSKPTFKVTNYNLDGSGRDTYIKSNNGGFFPSASGLRRTFFDKLRTYEDRPDTGVYLERRKKKTVKLTSDGRIVPDEDIFLRS